MADLKIAVDDQIELSPLQVSDADELFALIDANREHLRQWLPWVDGNKIVADSLKFIQESQNRVDKNLGFDLAIRFQGKLVGVAGANTLDLLNKKAELGYWLAKPFEGQGIMTKSVKAILKYLFQDLKLHRVQIDVSPGNEKSEAIPIRLGFTKEGLQRESGFLYGRYLDLQTFSLLEDAYTP